MRLSNFLNSPKIFCVSLLLVSTLWPATAPAQERLTLERIEFVGQKRLTISQLTSLSELKIGQVVDRDIFDAAAGKLLQSGLLRKLSYRVRSAKGRATITFQVEEAAANLPAVFENFVWFTDEELISAIRTDVPFFNGTAPAAGETLDKMTAALQRLLDQRKITGRVEAMPNLTGEKFQMIFTVKGARVPVCAIHFPGAKAIAEADLIKASQPILKAEYSQKDIAAFPQVSLIPLYRHAGHLRAEFQTHTAVFENSAQCPSGVVVTIPVEEGAAFTWGRSEWNGNEKLTVEELATALGMNPGELADGLKIDNGLKQVRLAYARRGHITAQIKDTFDVEPKSSQVNYRFFITEGPRYFMGDLIVNGVTQADADQLKAKWKLGGNTVFDETYVEEFRQSVMPDFIRGLMQKSPTRARVKAEFDTRPDAVKNTVDVVITFK
jgi:outer membrane protein assembly factor BamA